MIIRFECMHQRSLRGASHTQEAAVCGKLADKDYWHTPAAEVVLVKQTDVVLVLVMQEVLADSPCKEHAVYLTFVVDSKQHDCHSPCCFVGSFCYLTIGQP